MFYAHLEPFEIFGKKSYRLLRPPFASRALRARAGEGVKNCRGASTRITRVTLFVNKCHSKTLDVWYSPVALIQGRRQDLGLGGGGSSSNVLSTSSHFTAGGGPRKLAKGAHMVRYEFCHPNMSRARIQGFSPVREDNIARSAKKFAFLLNNSTIFSKIVVIQVLFARSARKICNLGPSCTLLAPPSSCLRTGPPRTPTSPDFGGVRTPRTPSLATPLH